MGNNITIGYFDQYSAAIQSEKTVVEHFSDLFPSLTDKEVRTILGAYLFKGKDGAKRVDDLSGGEKARLVLAELLIVLAVFPALYPFSVVRDIFLYPAARSRMDTHTDRMDYRRVPSTRKTGK